MELILPVFFLTFLPELLAIISNGVKTNYKNLPNDQDILGAISKYFGFALFGIGLPGLSNNVAISSTDLASHLTIKNEAKVKTFLDTMGIVVSEMDSPLVLLINWVKSLFESHTEEFSNSMRSFATSIPKNPDTPLTYLPIDYSNVLKSKTRAFAKLLADDAVEFDDEYSLLVEGLYEYADYTELVQRSTTALVELSIRNNVGSVLTLPYMWNTLIENHGAVYSSFCTVTNNINGNAKVLGVISSAPITGLNIVLRQTVGDNHVHFDYYATLDSGVQIGCGFDDSVVAHQLPYDFMMQSSDATVTQHEGNQLIGSFWSPSTDAFFSGMTTEEIFDMSNYNFEFPILNNGYSDSVTEMYPAFIDQAIGSKLIADEYDVVGAGNSAVGDNTLTDVLYPTTWTDLGTGVGADNLADVLYPTLTVYPVDTVTEETVTTVPITLSDAITNIDTSLQNAGANVGNALLSLTSAFGEYGMFTLYKMTISQLRDLSSKLWSQDFMDNFHPFQNNPSEALISLMAYPIDVSSAENASTIICGNYNCSPAAGKIVNNLFQEHDLGTVHIDEIFNDFSDYSPYTKISLYLPFVGIVRLDPDEVMGADINIKYRIELLTGTATAMIKVTKGVMSAVLYQYSCNMGMTLPLSASDFSRTYTSLLTSTGSVVAGALTGNAALVGVGAAGIANQVASSKPDINKAGGMSGNSSMCGNMAAYLIIDTAVPDVPDGYKTFKGTPTNKYVTVGSLSGYVQLDDFYLNDVVITDSEKKELEALLKTGIIL